MLFLHRLFPFPLNGSYMSFKLLLMCLIFSLFILLASSKKWGIHTVGVNAEGPPEWLDLSPKMFGPIPPDLRLHKADIIWNLRNFFGKPSHPRGHLHMKCHSGTIDMMLYCTLLHEVCYFDISLGGVCSEEELFEVISHQRCLKQYVLCWWHYCRIVNNSINWDLGEI